MDAVPKEVMRGVFLGDAPVMLEQCCMIDDACFSNKAVESVELILAESPPLPFAEGRLKLDARDYSISPPTVRKAIPIILGNVPENSTNVAKAKTIYSRPRARRLKYSEIRDYFHNDFDIRYYSLNYKHSHRVDASIRTSVAFSLASAVQDMGYIPYHVSLGSRDRDHIGSHKWIIPKDMQVPPRTDPITRSTFFIMVDVDYYLDMGHYLSLFRPIVMYTFCPNSLVGSVGDTSWSILSDGRFDVRVNGGGTYRHRVWDYDHDCIYYRTTLYVYVYLVEIKDIPDNPNRRIVLLIPLGRISRLAQLFPCVNSHSLDFTQGNKLQYKCYSSAFRSCRKRGKIVVEQTAVDPYPFTAQYKVEDVEYVSIVPCSGVCSDIPKTAFGLSALKADVDGKPNQAVIERVLKAKTGKADLETVMDTYVIHAALAKGQTITPSIKTSGGKVAVIKPSVYTVDVTSADATAIVEDTLKTQAVCVSNPIVTHPAVMPSQGYNNEMASAVGRVLGPNKDIKTLSRNRYLHASEFARCVIPDNIAHKGIPILKTDVIDLQTKSRQRARSELVMPCIAGSEGAIGKGFVKAEPMADIKDPRPITSTNTKYQLDLQSYIMSIKDDIDFSWYTPGKSCKEIAMRVTDMCETGSVIQTDYSRFDATIGKLLRALVEDKVLLRWVSRDFVHDLRQLLKSEHQLSVTTRHGFHYETNGQRASGTPLTTFGNTMITAYVQYSSLRECGYGVAEAFSMVGMCFGDDGLLPCYDRMLPVHLHSISGELGLSLKCEVKHRHTADYVTFLSRDYPEAWYGNIGSMQNPLRSYPKIHISSTGSSYPLGVCIANKAAGILALDPTTPVSSNYGRMLVRFAQQLGGHVSDYNPDMPFMVRESGTWPQLDPPIAIEHIARLYKVEAKDVIDWCNRLDHITEYGEEIGMIDNEKVECGLAAVVGEIGNARNVGDTWECPRQPEKRSRRTKPGQKRPKQGRKRPVKAKH
nr:MAG: RNA-dependent RNA polymerase [Jingmen shrew nodavirus 1]